MIVMDPLALPLSCACVEGTGQRRYEAVGNYLEAELGRPVEVMFEESVGLAMRRLGEARAHLIVGKRGVVQADTKALGIAARPIAELTDLKGETGLRGVFLVRKDDPAEGLEDLAGKRIALGPEEDEDCHGAALRALKAAGLEGKVEVVTSGSIDAASLALHDGEADAAVVSGYLPRLLEGCGKIEPGTTRTLARTEAVPFVEVWATENVSEKLEAEMVAALEAVVGEETVLSVMESAKGFLRAAAARGGWTDWRGPGRTGISEEIPKVLPEEPVRIWTAAVTGPAMAGAAVTEKFVVVPDKDADFTRDIFRCLDAATGKEVWTLEYEAAEEVDYSNAPRATPVIVEELVYLQGATGELHCVTLTTGRVVWRTNLFKDYGAELLFWGSSIAPLVVDDLLVFTPGAEEASIVAVDRRTGELRWKAAGHAAAYSSFVLGTFSGVRQIVGYDVGSLGGWDPESGERLWAMVPPDSSDFNVTTPIVLGERILLATENNATRLYEFGADGRLIPEPVAVNNDLAPDTCTPVVIDGRVYGTAYGEMFCLDLEKGLETVWSVEDDMFYDHTNVLAGNGRVMVWTMSGDLVLLKAGKGSDAYEVVSKWKPFGDGKLDTMAHPAIAGGRIYLRGAAEVACFSLGE